MDLSNQTNKEKQHYVPKFYLRRFSCLGDNKTIGVYNPSTKLYVPRAPLRSQACSPYFYGRDGVLEDELSQIEGLTAETLRVVATLESQIQKRSQIYSSLLFHIVLSTFRTSGRTQNFRQQMDDIHDLAFADMERLPLEAAFMKPSHEMAVELVMAGIKKGFNLCSDLEIKIIKNESLVPFITCDDPVLLYNQLLEKYNIPAGITGLAHAGLQILLPIDPTTLVLAYDSRYYKVGKKGNELIYCTKDDVDRINLLSMLSYEKAVFFSDRASKEYLDSLGALSLKFEKANIMISKKYYKVGKKNGEFVYSDEEPEKYESFLISNYSTSLRTRLQLSFIRFTREAARFTPYKIGGNMRPRCAEIHKRDHQYDSRTPYTFTYADE